MGKFVTRLIVVCNVDGVKSANGKIRYALFVKPSQVNQLDQSLNQYTHGYNPATSAYSKEIQGGLLVCGICLCGVGSASPNNCR